MEKHKKISFSKLDFNEHFLYEGIWYKKLVHAEGTVQDVGSGKALRMSDGVEIQISNQAECLVPIVP